MNIKIFGFKDIFSSAIVLQESLADARVTRDNAAT